MRKVRTKKDRKTEQNKQGMLDTGQTDRQTDRWTYIYRQGRMEGRTAELTVIIIGALNIIAQFHIFAHLNQINFSNQLNLTNTAKEG